MNLIVSIKLVLIALTVILFVIGAIIVFASWDVIIPYLEALGRD